MHLASLAEARAAVADLHASGRTIGSIHTLGALHAGHAELIKHSAAENDVTVVTIYPNKIQLFPGMLYEFDLASDVEVATAAGATMVISSTDEEMFPEDYQTFLDQGAAYRALNSSVFSFATRGQVTGCIRWLNFVRPRRTYLGLKDIEQAIMIRRAAIDLLMDVEVVYVPCVRMPLGTPLASRLRKLDEAGLAELGGVYQSLLATLDEVRAGERDATTIKCRLEERVRGHLDRFSIKYVAAVDETLQDVAEIAMPFILHVCVTDGNITHFDGVWIRNQAELECGPPVIWLDAGPRP
jgi:pantoate--beta-alanine ligase